MQHINSSPHVRVSEKKPQVLVCQYGARRRYAVPRMLAQENMLAALYTDSSSKSFLGKIATFLGATGPAVVTRLANRKIIGVPDDKVFSSDLNVCKELCRRLQVNKRDDLATLPLNDSLSSRMIRWGLQGADIVYSMYDENLSFLRWVKKQGTPIIIDVFVSPGAELELAEEAENYPFMDFGNKRRSAASRNHRQRLWSEAAELADCLMCPSEYVAEGIARVSPREQHKIRMVPYGCSLQYQGEKNSPTVGRILFVGGEPLRKGLHYLAQATAQLRAALPDLEVRVAGAIPGSLADHPLFADFRFLGKLDAKRLKAEFLAADLFVLPSLCEGFAGVVAEAINAGCPVIVTRECGSLVQDEREGLIVPSRDSEALATAIGRLVLDRQFRDRCSTHCYQVSEDYSEHSWRQRLAALILEVYHTNEGKKASR